MTRIDLVGRTFGTLTVVAPAQSVASGAAWDCVCNCGRTRSRIAAVNLKSGHTTSCGSCARSVARMKHGESTVGGRRKATVEYTTWVSILGRCYNDKCKDYRNYGARGILMCERWRNSFESFLGDMGRRPSAKHSIDRFPDTNGNYEPSNCRWATATEQARNKRSTLVVEHAGERLLLIEWAERLGVKYATLWQRYRDGHWPNRQSKRLTRGVNRVFDTDRWVASITSDGRRRYLGTFSSEADAARAYDDAARRIHGASACLNLPGPGERSIVGEIQS